ncbi:MAG TPA: hypothetical protein VNM37_05340 [Candidatus Dormibacteraeota bacterium]|nr:hypothetical protein [Candidatus Dormibacteraeota bacterium]
MLPSAEEVTDLQHAKGASPADAQTLPPSTDRQTKPLAETATSLSPSADAATEVHAVEGTLTFVQCDPASDET